MYGKPKEDDDGLAAALSQGEDEKEEGRRQ